MVSYQNLILNSQNKIEDLKIELENIKNQIVPNLKMEKENILNVTIKDLELKIDNIKKVTIANLQAEKENILNVTIKDLELKIENIKNITIINLQRNKQIMINDTLRKLEYRLNVSLPNQKAKFIEKIEQLKYQISEQNIKNSEIVGHFIIKNYPIKPKKKLIVVVVFVTGFILSVFLVFFLNFIAKEEDKH